jgi:hypothetical protein
MRLAFRSFTTVLSAAALASCADVFGHIDPSGSRSTLAIAPRFSRNASLASATLAQAGLDFDHARIVIVRPASDTLKDTTIAFTPTSTELTLELAIAAVPAEELVAAIAFSQGSTVLFSGSANVRAIALTEAGRATPVEIVVSYTGPGSTAATVKIQPRSGLYSATEATAFTARGLTADNVEVPDTPIAWSVSDERLATISATGVLTPKGQRGSVYVIAASPTAKADTITANLSPPAASLRVVQGASQTGAPGSTLELPVIVEAIAADGLPALAAGTAITFAAGADAQITPATATLDANSRAKATMKVGSRAGTTYLYKATMGEAFIQWGATATAGRPTHFVARNGTSFRFKAGVIPAVEDMPTLRVADSLDNAVPGVSLRITATRDGAQVATGVIPADSIGLLEIYRAPFKTAGTYTILVESVDVTPAVPSITYTIVIDPAAPAKLVFREFPAAVVSGRTVSPAIVVKIYDQYDNLVTGPADNVNLENDPATGVTMTGTGSVSPTGGVAMFSTIQFSTTTPRTGYRIKATGANLPPTTSPAFDITLPPL